MRRAVHRTIADVTRDLERWSYNTAVAHCMELLNTPAALRARGARRGRDGDGAGHGAHADVWDEALDALLRLLAP